MVEQNEEIKIDLNIQSAYDEQYDDSITRWREIGAEGKAKNIVELTRGNTFKKVLEVGAGEGSILMWLDKWNYTSELYALEISKSGLEHIQKRNLRSVKEAKLFNGYKIPYEDNAFDLVICSHVIEHVEYPRLLLREIKRVSKYQVFEVPIDFTFSVDKKLDLFLSYGHINIFTPSLFRFLVKSEGFEILKDKNALYIKGSDLFTLEKIKKEKGLVPYLVHYARVLKKRIFWKFRPAGMKDRKPETYTVFCKKTDKSLEIMKK